MEVHQAGGGINFTVEKTREASEDQLLELLMSRLARMLRAGKGWNEVLFLGLNINFATTLTAAQCLKIIPINLFYNIPTLLIQINYILKYNFDSNSDTLVDFQHCAIRKVMGGFFRCFFLSLRNDDSRVQIRLWPRGCHWDQDAKGTRKSQDSNTYRNCIYISWCSFNSQVSNFVWLRNLFIGELDKQTIKMFPLQSHAWLLRLLQ